MKKNLLIAPLLLAAFVFLWANAPAAHAQAGQSCLLPTDCGIGSGLECINSTCQAPPSNYVEQSSGGATSTPTNYVEQSSGNQAPTPTAAKTITPPDFGGGDISTQVSPIMIVIMKLFAWLVGIAAITLDNAVYYTVVTMGNYISGITAIGTTWRVLRDVGNILLIFGFLASGIAIILDTKLYGWGKTAIPRLLMAAVLINFSLFAAEAVIDVSNLFATQFYTQINGGAPAQPLSYTGSAINGEGISNAIMGQLGLSTVMQVQTNPAALQGGHVWVIGFMGILLFIVTAFVLFSLAFILIARFIYLVFVIILAPIGVVGWVMPTPKLQALASWWWGKLVDNAITAPILLMLLYVALAVITDANFLKGFVMQGDAQGSWLSFVNQANLVGFAGLLLSFLIAMGLLLAVVMVAKKLSGFGTDLATKAAGTVVGGAVGYGLFGGASLVGRGTLGLAGRGLNSQRIQARASKGGFWGAAARVGAFTGRNLEKRTFDVRNVKTLSRVAGAAVGAAGGFGAVNEISRGVGKGATVTAKQAVDKTIETKEKYIGKDTLKSIRNLESPFTGAWWRDQQREYEKAAKERDQKGKIADVKGEDFSKTLNKMSVDELAELRGIRKGLSEYAEELSPAKYAELQKSDKLLKAEKDNLKNAWKKQFEGSDEEVRKALERFKPADIAALDTDILVSHPIVIQKLAPAKYTELQKGDRSQADKDSIKKVWVGQFEGGSDKIKQTMDRLKKKTEDVAALDGDVLTKPEVIEHLGPQELDAIRRKNILDTDERRVIYAAMEKRAGSDDAFKKMFESYFGEEQNKFGEKRQEWWDVSFSGKSKKAAGGANQIPSLEENAVIPPWAKK